MANYPIDGCEHNEGSMYVCSFKQGATFIVSCLTEQCIVWLIRSDRYTTLTLYSHSIMYSLWSWVCVYTATMNFQQCSSSQFTFNGHASSSHAFTTGRNERKSEIYIVRIRIHENYGRCRRAIAIYFRRVRKGVSHAHKSYRISRVLFVLKKKSKFLYFCCCSIAIKVEAFRVSVEWNDCVWVRLNMRININFKQPQ